jgi:molybdenum cofactor synthesis domain-containing protein
LDASGFETVLRVTVPDEQPAIEDSLRQAAGSARLVVTTGGTGIGKRDVTPEATRAVCERMMEGRRETPLARLSRAVCGTLGTSMILNLPGSPAGAVSSLRAALPVLPHALDLLEGKTEHGAATSNEIRPKIEKAKNRSSQQRERLNGKVERKG